MRYHLISPGASGIGTGLYYLLRWYRNWQAWADSPELAELRTPELEPWQLTRFKRGKTLRGKQGGKFWKVGPYFPIRRNSVIQRVLGQGFRVLPGY